MQLSAYFGLITGGLAPVLMVLPIGQRRLESVRSIAEVLPEANLEENEGKAVVRSVSGLVRFDHVGFRYPDAETDAVVDVDLEVAAGETIAFVLEHGSSVEVGAHDKLIDAGGPYARLELAQCT
ncbi:hypothetical protein [Georgenia muralis]